MTKTSSKIDGVYIILGVAYLKMTGSRPFITGRNYSTPEIHFEVPKISDCMMEVSNRTYIDHLLIFEILLM